MKVKSRRSQTKRRRLNVDVTLPKDYPWKILRCMAEDLRHLLDEGEYLTLCSVVRRRDFEEYIRLTEVWGLQSNSLKGMALAKARALYQLATLLKKFRFETALENRIATAERKFIEAEEACAHYNHEGYRMLFEPGTDKLKPVFIQARHFLRRLLGETLPGGATMTRRSRHGPGANLDTKRGFNSAYHKFANWPYSCTIDAYRYARFLIQSDQRWLGALEDSYRKFWKIPKHTILDQKVFWQQVIQIVDGNRITFVPKDARTERSIAIEPSLNLYLQLGADGFIRKQLKRFGIDIDDQTKNQRLAQAGSLRDDDKSLVTLDLSAASDSISLRLCKELLPAEWFRYLCDLRSPCGTLGERTFSYEKISSMGNGVTFALETAIFASIVYGVMRTVEGRYDHTRCAIFGDDIIVPKKLAGKVVRSLAFAGFKTNSEKSFLFGPIRESCGTDWFLGKPIRPVLLKTIPTSVMGLFVDFNRLKRILSLRWGVDECESKTLQLIEKWIPTRFKDLYGPVSNECFDSYRHSDKPKGLYEFCLWKHKRLIVRPRRFKGESFLIRKLMHTLVSEPVEFWNRKTFRGARLNSSGSRFIVTASNRCTIGFKYSVSDIWRSTYSE